jgi:hypothetical protein
MERSAIAVTVEQKILAALVRIERKLDDTERRVKAVQQDLNRVKRIVRGREFQTDPLLKFNVPGGETARNPQTISNGGRNALGSHRN